MSKLPISVVINTFQAERYLDLVLRAVANHVEEIIVYTFALICLSVMFYDVFIDNCNGILRRTFLRINSE